MKKLIVFLYSSFFIIFCSNLYAQIEWTKYSGNPVLSRGETGTWDDENVGLAWILSVGDTLHIWYDANWDDNGGMNNGIGHATSVDGFNWSKDSRNPVLTPGPAGNWDARVVTQATVLFNSSDSQFHMWYAGWASSTAPSNIGHATSADGRYWLKDTLNNPVLTQGPTGSWDDFEVVGPSVVLLNDTLHMWYDGVKPGWIFNGIGHAISTDWKSWQKFPSNNPVLSSGNSSDWDYTEVRMGKVIHDGFRFHMFYAGGSWFTYDIGYAFSNDGINWTKYNNGSTDTPYLNSDPVLKKGPSDSWEDYMVGPGTVMFNKTGDSLRMWYSGANNGASTAQIGHAIALFDTTFITKINYLDDNFPNNFALHQNYPNPFNPVTLITYQLPMTGEVELSIYNLIGQKVATLLSEKQNAGHHQVEWDATGFASGVYYYRIETGNFVQTRKMIYLK